MYVTGTIINDEERIHAKDVYHRLGIDRPKTVKNLVAGAMRELGWDHVNSMRIGSGHPGLAIYENRNRQASRRQGATYQTDAPYQKDEKVTLVTHIKHAPSHQRGS
jgi:hypothetical protein